ncbi:MAG: hypothetical protein AAFW73_21530 [Bacteroidota bacterium]
MAKKKFTDGLESLFGSGTLEEKLQDSPLLSRTKKVNPDSGEPTESRPPQPKRKRRSGKNFTSDLDSLFEEVLQETVEEKMRSEKTAAVDVKVARSRPHQRRRPAMGLDVLIRHTSDMTREELMATSFQKRVTFVYDREKVAKLKLIAKEERRYMKDIIGQAVSQWLQQYESQHGKISDL